MALNRDYLLNHPYYIINIERSIYIYYNICYNILYIVEWKKRKLKKDLHYKKNLYTNDIERRAKAKKK
jgi:hypothetical protein